MNVQHWTATASNAPEFLKIYDIQRGDMIRQTAQVVLPVALPPELEAQRLLAARAEGRVAVRLALQVHVPQLLQIRPHHLVSIHVDYFLHTEGEQDIQEEDFISPDNPLLLRLLRQPLRPLIGDVGHLVKEKEKEKKTQSSNMRIDR